MVVCDICGKECAINAGLGQHRAFMHSKKSAALRAERSTRQKGKVPASKGKTKEELSYLARPEQVGKKFGISLHGHTADTKAKISNSMKGNQNANHRGDRGCQLG